MRILLTYVVVIFRVNNLPCLHEVLFSNFQQPKQMSVTLPVNIRNAINSSSMFSRMFFTCREIITILFRYSSIESEFANFNCTNCFNKSAFRVLSKASQTSFNVAICAKLLGSIIRLNSAKACSSLFLSPSLALALKPSSTIWC